MLHSGLSKWRRGIAPRWKVAGSRFFPALQKYGRTLASPQARHLLHAICCRFCDHTNPSYNIESF